jgi:uncharacterized membrane protein
MTDWVHAGTSILPAFLASLVEFVEALTVVLAIGIVRGWRSALAGTGLALAVLLVLVAVLGPALQNIPLDWIQLVIGVLLLLFGMRWLRKAILRAAGVIALHDEQAVFASETRLLSESRQTLASGWDTVALVAAFKIVMLEGIEVVFIVVAIGAASGQLLSACIGAGVALIAVVLLGLALHKPLALIPENALKFAVGVMLCAFGSFWTGEGIGIQWPGEDWSLPALVVGFLIIAGLAVAFCRRRRQHTLLSSVK